MKRLEDKRDGRAQLVILTTKGARLREQMNRLHNRSLDERFGVLNPAENKQLVSLLDHLRQGMAKYLEVE